MSTAPITPAPPALPAAVRDAAATAKIGVWIILLGLGGFLLWASLAPLAQGVAGSGTVVVAGERKTVQSLAGGSIEQILVREGDHVKEGQLLIQLNTVQAQSQLDVALGQWFSARSVEARLTAERLGLEAIRWPDELLARGNDPRARTDMELQGTLFETRRAELASRLQIMQNETESLLDQLASYQEIKKHLETQQSYQRQELEGLRSLAEEGYVPRNRLFEAERNAAQLSAQMASGIADIGKTRQAINESKLQMLQVQQAFRIEAESQLTATSAEASSLGERIKALEFEVRNAAIRAPVTGQVIGLAVHTEGGVIPAAQKLMDIVPKGSAWIIKAKFEPVVADRLKPGLPVNLRFSSLTSATLPVVEGKVLTVSGDQLIDEQTRLPYFAVEVEVGSDAVAQLSTHGLDVKPGMQAEVMVQTGERTFMNYLLKPLQQRIRGALKEE
ncbi:HlyD family type I secretion periplasmic adaptor subunit [Pseudomonas sp. J452]|uniref:HlyD family type I secretion periplasmic adaptor subunit n=1 Tax=Pseudomonas sp. J452 TaxID=2898441 RepID=UPI0021ADF9B6|nr:HlyD family type I secretion periplasmic adaptor subunit [Pseudomonas sp. J452]UUY09021.1 HlyD family type I secretion periplasmic adaptor subunit [Pseudomonas sp. J452]